MKFNFEQTIDWFSIVKVTDLKPKCAKKPAKFGGGGRRNVILGIGVTFFCGGVGPVEKMNGIVKANVYLNLVR